MAYTPGYDQLEYSKGMRVRILAAQVNAAAGLGTWCFVKKKDSPDENLIYSTCLKEKEFLTFLQLSGGLAFLGKRKEGWDRPVVLADSIGLVWVAEHAFEDGKPDMLIVMGPMFLSNTSLQYIDNALREKIHSLQTRLQMTRTLAEVPVLSASALDQYGKILHYSLTNQRIRSEDFIFQNDLHLKRAEKPEDEPQEQHNSDRLLQGEQQILAAVRDGNLQYREIAENELRYNGEYVCDTGNPMRDAKNTVLVLTTLCSRSAIEGGLPARSSLEMQKRYFAEIERAGSISALKNLKNAMLEEFVTRVHEVRENPLISKSIRECCDYIRVNVRKPLTVQEIAGQMGYTTYYFTKKFNREMGIKVTDYIKQARIEYAKVALITTDQSIQEISDSLQFGSRNYFSKVFHAIVGVTPAAYRERLRNGGEIDEAEGKCEHR